MSKNTTLVLDNAAALFNSEALLQVDPAELSDAEALVVWSLFDAFEKEVIKLRKEVFRNHLLRLAETKGMRDQKGSFEYLPAASDGKVVKQARKGKPSINKEAAEKLLASKDLWSKVFEVELRLSVEHLDELCDLLDEHVDSPAVKELVNRVKEPTLSLDRFESFVNLGEISLSELASVTTQGKPTYALKVTKPSVVTRMIKGGKRT